MPKIPGSRDDLDAYLRDLKVRLERAGRHTHNLPVPAKPAPAPAPPFVPPEPPVDTCISFTDDFERADGALGSDWTIAPENDYFDWVEVPMLIEDGDAITPDSTGSGDSLFGSSQWDAGFPGDNQFIEVCVYNLSKPSPYPLSERMNGQIRLYCQGDAISPEREEVWVDFGNGSSGGERRIQCYWYYPDGSYGDDTFTPVNTAPWAPALDDPTVCIRLEADADGSVRVYFDVGTAGATTLIASGVSASGHTGPYVGFRVFWFRSTLPTPSGGTSPRVLWADGGCLDV